MANRTKQKTTLQDLVLDFETMKLEGSVLFLEDKSYLDLIELYQSENQTENALEVVDFALVQFQFRSDFYFIKSKLLFGTSRLEESLKCILKAEKIAPFEFDIQFFKIQVYLELGQTEEAEKSVKELEQTCSKSDLPDLFLIEALIYEKDGEFDLMFQSLKKTLLLDSSHKQAMKLILESVELSKNFEESIFLHKHVIDATPYNGRAWYNLGHAYSCVGEYEFAIDAFEYSFIIDPMFEEGYMDCAELCFQLQDYEKALSIYDEAYEHFGFDSDIILNIAHCQFNLNYFDQAELSLKKAIKLDPYYDEAYYLLANCYLQEEKYKEAIKALNKAIYLDDTREEYYHSLARCYVSIGEFRKAKRNYHSAAVKGLEQNLYWEEYTSFLIKLNLYEEAYLIIDEAEQHTYSDKLQYCKAATLIKLGQKKTALLVLEEAISENPDNLKFFFDLLPELKKDQDIQAAVRYFLG